MTDPGSSPDAARRSWSRRRLRIVALVLLPATALAVVTVTCAVLGEMSWDELVTSYLFTNLVIGIAFLAGGVVPLWCTRNAVGGLLAGAGLGHLTSAAATGAAVVGLGAGWPAAVIGTLSTAATGAWQLGIPLLFPLALLLFPDGRLPGARWRIGAWLIVLSGAFQAVTGMLSDGSAFSDSPVANPITSIGLELPPAVMTAAGLASSAAYLIAIAALVWRAVRGSAQVRRQLMWLLLALVVITILNAERAVTGDGPILLLLSAVLIPAAMAVAIVRDQLFDIRLVLSRTLLYGLVIALIIIGYAGIVAVVTRLLPPDVDREVAIGAAIVVAVAFTPVRLVLQRIINRAFYGSRSDPTGTVRSVGEGLRQQGDLGTITHQIREQLRLPYVGVRREVDGTLLAESGRPEANRLVELELTNRDLAVGTLVIGLRRGESQLHRMDRRALELVATPLALALDATRLTAQVSAARTAVVEAAALERTRLQRELHDGVGPTLTSATFLADAASNLLLTDPVEADRMLAEVRAELRSASDDVRRVVYGLRPIELDDSGLLGAVRQKVEALRAEDGGRLALELELPAELPAMSPAIELAAYRIVGEALSNVLRHSGGRRCRISVAAESDLVLEVRDDGTPPASFVPGVGVRSILTRAEELGGTASAGPEADGWVVTARLPLVPASGLPTSATLPPR